MWIRYILSLEQEITPTWTIFTYIHIRIINFNLTFHFECIGFITCFFIESSHFFIAYIYICT